MVNEQVAIQATGSIIRYSSGSKGGSANLSGHLNLARSEKVCWDPTFSKCKRERSCSFKHPEGCKEVALCELLSVLGKTGVAKARRIWTERKAAGGGEGPSTNNHEVKKPTPKGASHELPAGNKAYALGWSGNSTLTPIRAPTLSSTTSNKANSATLP